AGGSVKIDCQANGPTATMSVEDAGHGISSDFLPHVFERFRQEYGSKTRAHGGLGLGLALVKSFVEAHQGTIEAASAGQGLGSRFTITLPCTAALGADEWETTAVPHARPAAAHLMIIEDDTDTLEMLRATLERNG